jgi:hypothetical protein
MYWYQQLWDCIGNKGNCESAQCNDNGKTHHFLEGTEEFPKGEFWLVLSIVSLSASFSLSSPLFDFSSF